MSTVRFARRDDLLTSETGGNCVAARTACRSRFAFVMAVAAFLASPLAQDPAFAQESQGSLPTTWQELDNEALALAPEVSILAAEITGGTCKPVHGLNPEKTLAIGSSFKLYILGALGLQIARRGIGSAPWDDLRDWFSFEPWSGGDPWPAGGRPAWLAPLTLEARFKSIPQGALLFVPDGSIFTTRFFAEKMIQESDNTATDHLLFRIGREKVEQAMAEFGHHDPSLNTPLWATREFAVTKFLWSDAELAAYEAASDSERRRMLADEKRGWPALLEYFETHGEQTEPVRIDTVEWFADRYDMCSVLLGLHEMAREPRLRPVTEVLALQDPIGIDREKWTYVGFKGGSELGVLAGNWLLQRNDGRLFTLTAAFNDSERALDLPRIIEILQAAVEILFTGEE